MERAGPATVVVARRIAGGREPDFQRWVRRIVQAAERATGFVGATVQPPNDDHPGEWVVVYQFRSPEDLDAWLSSERRAAIVEDAGDLITSQREQRVVSPATDPVTLVSSIELREGTEDEHRDLHARAMAAARRSGGLVSVELREPVDGAQRETVSLLTFASRGDLDRWLDSDERRTVLAEVDELASGDRTLNVVGGFVGLFDEAGPAGPTRWKQAIVILTVLLPLVFGTPVVLGLVAPGLDAPWSVIVATAVNVVLLTWLVMPPVTRLLRPWLTR